MKCPECGAENPDGAAYCDLCFQKFGPPAAGGSPPPPPGRRSETAPAPAPKRRGTAIKVGGACLLVLALAVGGVFAYSHFAHGRRANPNPKTVRVLFLGNSYTYYNDLPATIALIAKSHGNTLIYDSYAPGGYTLQQHAADPNAMSKISSQKWDFVVLQEQSQRPAVYTGSDAESWIAPYARQLDVAIHQVNPSARTVLYETWGRKNGDSDFSARVPEVATYAGDQARITNTYRQLALDLSGTIAPVGEAWSQVRSAHPEIELYQSDGSHPSPAGTYLAASIFNDIFFNDRSEGAAGPGLDSGQAKVLQQAADGTIYPVAPGAR